MKERRAVGEDGRNRAFKQIPIEPEVHEVREASNGGGDGASESVEGEVEELEAGGEV